MALCLGYKIDAHASEDVAEDGATLCAPCEHRLSVDIRPQLSIRMDLRTDELEAGDVVQLTSGELQKFVRTEPISGSDYVTLVWQDGGMTFSTTAEPWNIWPYVVRADHNG